MKDVAKKPNGKERIEQASTSLAHWARKLAVDDLPEQEEEQMTRMVNQHLNAGQDEVFERAFEKLSDPRDAEAYDALADFVSFEAETLHIQGEQHGDMFTKVAMLFVIPAIFLQHAPLSLPAWLSEDQTGIVARSLRIHGLVNADTPIMLYRHWYSMESLQFLRYSRRRVALKRMISAMFYGEESSQLPIDPDNAMEENHFAVLRFLIGTVIFDIDNEEGLFPLLEYDHESLESWKSEIEEALSNEMVSVLPRAPGMFGTAVDNSVDYFHSEAFGDTLIAILKAEREGMTVH